VDLTYEDYDQATGEYATLTQTVNISSGDVSSNHDLLVHLGAGLGDGMGVNLQVYWERNRAIVEMLDYINDYENTGAPSDATMTSRRPRTATSVNMDESDPGELRIEPEFGLQSGSFTTHNALSFTLFNMLGQDRFQETESRYDLGFGTDDTVLDQEKITVTAGQYTWNGANPNAAIVMNTSIPTVNASLIMGLDSRNYLDGVLGGVLGIPFQASVTLYPGDEQFSRETVTTVTYDDAVATPRETEREVVTTTTSLDEALAMSFVSGAQLLKTIPAGETAAVHLGVDLDVSYWRETLQKSQARTTRTQVDGNTDGDYADAGTDVDTTYTESGYVITAQNGGFWVSMGLPLAVSYTPFPALTFYAGTTTSAQVNVTSSRSLEEGIGTAGAPDFVYEQYTDNLEAANSYSQRVIDGSETNTLPDQATSTTTSFSASADFGFTLDLSEQVTVDARATSSGSLGFEQFSVTAIYRY
jgi:hypothetical protein